MTAPRLYLLHFDRALGDPSRPRMSARHYLGYTGRADLEARLAEHAAGAGARITAALVAGGGTFALAWSRAGTRTQERALKRSGHFADRLCPICKAAR